MVLDSLRCSGLALGRACFMFLLAGTVTAIAADVESTVPDVTGLDARNAVEALRQAGLKPKFLLGPPATRIADAQHVFQLKPVAGTRVPRGTTIELTIYDSPTEATTPASRDTNEAKHGTTRKPRESVIGHTFNDAVATAVDLNHGRGARQLTVRRITMESPDAAQPFGPGWSDTNCIVQTEVEGDSLWLWRGGEVIANARRLGDEIRTDGGWVVTKTDSGWRWTTRVGEALTVNAEGRATEFRSSSGQATRYEWDTLGRLIAVAQDQNNTLRYTYDSKDRVIRIEGPEGLTCDYEYDTSGHLAAAVSARQIRALYKYSQHSRLSVVTDSLGGEVRPQSVTARPETASAGQAIAAIRGNRDELNLAAGVNKSILPSARRPKYEYNDRGQVTVKRHLGVTTRYAYDDSGRVIAIATPNGKLQFEYDEFDRIVAVIRPSGQTCRYSYSRFDDVSRVDESGGSWAELTFDDHGRPIDWTYSSGHSVQAEYGSDGYYRTIRWSPSLSATRQYDPAGRLLSSTQSIGRSISFRYDEDGRLTERSSAVGSRESLTYNDDGRPIQWAIGDHVRTFEYSDGRLSGITDPVFGERRLGYEQVADGEISLSWKGLGTWRRRVNEWRQPVEFERPSGQTWKYRYDARTSLVETLTPLQRAWNYSRDASGRLTGIDFPASHSTRIDRSPRGRVTRIERNGITQREFLHDQHGRVRLASSPLGLAAVYSHDTVGRVREVVVPEGKVAYSYNESGLVDRVTGPDYDIQQEFHANGSLARRVYEPAGLDLKLPYDNVGRSAGMELNGVGVVWKYDPHGRVRTVDLPDQATITLSRDTAGRVTGIEFGSTVAIKQQLDQASRTISLQASTAAGNSLFDERYTYDKAGNLARIQSSAGDVIEQAYDDDDRLIEVKSEEQVTRYDYSLDDDLRTITTDGIASRWELDNAGRPRMFDLSVVYDWDEAGNLTEVQSVDTDIINGFDAAGRLIKRTMAGLEWTFGYLPNGDRLWQNGPSGKISYVYLPTGLVGWKDENNTTWLLVTLPGTDRPLALCNSNGESLFLIADRLGSIRRVCDTSGAIVSSSDYGPYGRTIAADGFAPLNVYAGMVCDEHGLHYARRRYYDPLLSRFISLDPQIGKPAFPGSLNAYAYAASNPYRYRDTGGTAPKPVDRGTPSLSDKEAERTAARFFARTTKERILLEAVFAGEDLVDSAAPLIDLATGAAALLPWDNEDLESMAQASSDLVTANPAPDDLPGNLFAFDPFDRFFPGSGAVAGTDAVGGSDADGTTATSAPSLSPPTPHPSDLLDVSVLDHLFTGESNDFVAPGSDSIDPASVAGAATGLTARSTPTSPLTAETEILTRMRDNTLKGGLADGQKTWHTVLAHTLTGKRPTMLPAVRRLPIDQIIRRIDQNLDRGRPPFSGIYPDSEVNNPYLVQWNNAVKKALELADRGSALEKQFDDAKRALDTSARDLNNVMNGILGSSGVFSDVVGLSDQVDTDVSFDDLEKEVRKLNQLAQPIDRARSSLADTALARAEQLDVCRRLEQGYDPAESETLRREATADIARARKALEIANDLNAQKRDSDKQFDKLREQMSRVTELMERLRPFLDIRQRLDDNRAEFDSAYDNFNDAYTRFARMMLGQKNQGEAPGSPVSQQILDIASQIEDLTPRFQRDPVSVQLGKLIRSWRLKFRDQFWSSRDPNAGRRHIQGLLGADRVSQLSRLHRLDKLIPENAEQLLAQADEAVRRAKAILETQAENARKTLDDDRTKAYQAWQLIRKAEDCRNRFLSAPSSRPLTGSIQTAELLKALNPRTVQLRPRHAESLIPGHPFSALGHPADLHSQGKTVVPNVVGMSAPKAVRAIKDAGLIPKPQLGTSSRKGVKPFHVFAQVPKGGQRVAKNTAITFTISRTEPTLASTTPTKKAHPDKPPKKSATPEPAAKKSNLDGTYVFQGEFKVMASRFDWKQITADTAEITFYLDGKEPSNLRAHGLPATVKVNAKKSGSSYQIPKANRLNEAMVTALESLVDGITAPAGAEAAVEAAKKQQRANVKTIWSPSYTLTPEGNSFKFQVNSTVKPVKDRAVRR